MIEKAIFAALIAFAAFVAVGAVGDALNKMNQKTACALDNAPVCIVDGKVD